MSKVVKFPAVQKAREKKARPEPIPYQWTCKVCEFQIGVASSTIMQLTIAPVIKGLKVVGGTKIKVCAFCWQRGIKTEVF